MEILKRGGDKAGVCLAYGNLDKYVLKYENGVACLPHDKIIDVWDGDNFTAMYR